MKLFIATLAFVMGVAVAAPPANAGSIRGTITVNGLRSPENVLVYLSKAPAAKTDMAKAEFIMDQKDLTFHPQVLPIPVGATVQFPNNDKVDHNVFSLSRTKSFNFGSYKPGESKTVVFDQSGVVELRCDVHAEMLAYILVMKNPYFGITDEKGNFEIPDPRYLKDHHLAAPPELPAGSYILKTRHAKLKTVKEIVEVPAKGAVAVQLKLTRGQPGALYKR